MVKGGSMKSENTEKLGQVDISQKIHLIRDQYVMLDSDLADLYGVETKQLKRAVRRNLDRFPGDDFMFQLEKQELTNLRCQIGTLRSGHGRHRKYLPYVFTELGVAMLSSVLTSQTAIQVNIMIMRTFVQMRKVLVPQNQGESKLDDLERIQKIHGHLLHEHNDSIAILFDEIQKLEKLPDNPPKKIGFIK
jgi:hypothetical protein